MHIHEHMLAHQRKCHNNKIMLAEVPKAVPKPVAGYDRSPAPLPREQRDRVDAKRKELLVCINIVH